MRIKPPSKATLRVFAIAITAIMCTLVILSAVFPFPEGTWDFLSIGTSYQASANPGIGSFLYKKKLSFNTTSTGANVTTNQTNFPICVDINTSSWTNSTERDNFFAAWNVGGKRCQFFDSDGTTNLGYEVELYSQGGENISNIQTFTSTPVSSTWTVPVGVTSVEVLVVGGGGGGSSGGGGAGGLVHNASYTVTPGANLTVTVGAGGAGSLAAKGVNGGDSYFDVIHAHGGGGGGRYDVLYNGADGGSGGGGSSYSGGTSIGGAATQDNSSGTGYGYAGGGNAGQTASPYPSGGGGGAGAAGASAPGASTSGGGGIGKDYSSNFGTSVGVSGWFAGGGGGGLYGTGTAGSGGQGGGGDGKTGSTTGATGGTNTGGGGGGSGNGGTGGAGGSGVVIIKYTYTATAEAIYWVEVPQVDGNSSADYIWCAFGNDPNGTDQDNPEGVWTPDYKYVNHMSDSGCGLTTITDTANIWNRAVIVNGQRYIAKGHVSDSPDGGYIRIYEADANWATGDLITTSSFLVGDWRAIAFESVIPNTIIVSGMYRTSPKTAFIATYNITSDTWAEAHTTNAFYLHGVTYYDGYFYIAPVCFDAGLTWNEKIVKFLPADITTFANWTTTSFPDPQEGLSWYETSYALFGTNMFFMQHAYTTYQWRLLKWDFATNFTTIDYSSDNTTAPAYDLIPVPGSNAIMVTVMLPYRTPSAYWDLRYSLDGTNWTSVANITALNSSPTCEHFGTCCPISATEILVGVIDEQTTPPVGSYQIFRLGESAPFAVFQGISSHSADQAMYPIMDGARLVFSGQDYINPPPTATQLNIFDLNKGLLDSTANRNPINKATVGHPLEGSGQVGNAQDFTPNDVVTSPDSASLDFTANITVALSVNMDNGSTGGYLFTKDLATQGHRQYFVVTDALVGGDNKLIFYMGKASNPNLLQYWYTTEGHDLRGSWHRVVFVKNGTAGVTYIDGVPVSINASGSFANITTVDTIPLLLGAGPASAYPITGLMDEFTMSSTVWTADWAKLDYYNVKKTNFNGDSWLSWGSQEDAPAPAITNTPDIKDFGILEVNTTSNTTLTCFSLNNTGNCAVDITIQGTNLVGGDDTWTLSGNATPGTNIYGLKAGLSGGDYTVVVNTTANDFVSGLAEATTQAWGLKLYMPTSVSGYDAQQMSGNVTLIASAA